MLSVQNNVAVEQYTPPFGVPNTPVSLDTGNVATVYDTEIDQQKHGYLLNNAGGLQPHNIVSIDPFQIPKSNGVALGPGIILTGTVLKAQNRVTEDGTPFNPTVVEFAGQVDENRQVLAARNAAAGNQAPEEEAPDAEGEAGAVILDVADIRQDLAPQVGSFRRRRPRGIRSDAPLPIAAAPRPALPAAVVGNEVPRGMFSRANYRSRQAFIGPVYLGNQPRRLGPPGTNIFRSLVAPAAQPREEQEEEDLGRNELSSSINVSNAVGPVMSQPHAVPNYIDRQQDIAEEAAALARARNIRAIDLGERKEREEESMEQRRRQRLQRTVDFRRRAAISAPMDISESGTDAMDISESGTDAMDVDDLVIYPTTPGFDRDFAERIDKELRRRLKRKQKQIKFDEEQERKRRPSAALVERRADEATGRELVGQEIGIPDEEAPRRAPDILDRFAALNLTFSQLTSVLVTQARKELNLDKVTVQRVLFQESNFPGTFNEFIRPNVFRRFSRNRGFLFRVLQRIVGEQELRAVAEIPG